MKKYILIAFVFFSFEGVKAQVQTLKKPLSKKTIQALPNTFVVLDTTTYNQLLQQSKHLEEQSIMMQALIKETTQTAEKNALNIEIVENQKRQIELMQQEIESLKKQLAEKNKKK
jgi:hypothetical protein